MVRKVRYLLEREGRYFARIVIPPHLRPFLGGKSELREPLGGDYRAALKVHHAAVAKLQMQIRDAEIRAADTGMVAKSAARYPLTDEQMALRLYRIRIDTDLSYRAEVKNWTAVEVDSAQVRALQAGYSGHLTDTELKDLVGTPIDYFQRHGNTSVTFGTLEWRKLAMALCAAEYEALLRLEERDQGDFNGKPTHPSLTSAEPVVPALPPVSLSKLFDDYIASRKLIGRGEESERRWKPVFEDLRKFVKHDDARRMTKQDVIKWRDKLLKTKSAKTVRDVWLSSLRTVLGWAVREDRLEENVAADVRQDVQKQIKTRERGFTEEEATTILKAAIGYQKGAKEADKTAAAKRWVPLLAAFTGARVTELTQLRKADVREKNGRFFIRITPDAGSVKTGQYRDVPLHSQVIQLGFDKFVAASAAGPLFYDASSTKDALSGARTVSGRLSEWLGGLDVVPDGVQPNHGWRHRFKTLGRELGYSDRVVDAICGHAGRTAGDNYGDVTLEAKQRVIDALKPYTLSPPEET